MQRLLVPTDFSDNARNALHYAASMAQVLKAELVLLHAYHIPYVHAEMPADMYQSAIDDAQQETEQSLKRLGDEVVDPKRVSYRLVGELGFAVETILSKAEAEQADMIIMGTQGANGIADIILGSITSSVIDRASLPVMGIPEGYQFSPAKNWVFATNYDASDLPALKHLTAIAAAFEATIRIVHVNSGSQYIEQQQSGSFKQTIQHEINYNNMTFEVLEADEVASGIEHYTQTNQVDGVALVKRKRNLLESLFHRSVTTKMGFHSSVPVLAYHE
jgi:nucleotide-binding universal stress UspA family protein